MFMIMAGVSLCRMERPPHGTRIPDGGVRIRGSRELRSGGIVVSAASAMPAASASRIIWFAEAEFAVLERRPPAHASKVLDEFNGQHVDVAVTLGCGDQCPLVRAAQRVDWKISIQLLGAGKSAVLTVLGRGRHATNRQAVPGA